MAVSRVSIWIWTSTKAPKTARGTYKYILAAKNGTVSGKGEIQNTTGNRLVLMALIEAMERMTKISQISVHTDNRYLFQNAAYLPAWAAAGWKRKDNKIIKNEDLWRRLWEAQRGHTLEYIETDVESIFKDWRDQL